MENGALHTYFVAPLTGLTVYLDIMFNQVLRNKFINYFVHSFTFFDVPKYQVLQVQIQYVKFLIVHSKPPRINKWYKYFKEKGRIKEKYTLSDTLKSMIKATEVFVIC